MPDSKEMRSAMSKVRSRTLDTERELMTDHPDVLRDKPHRSGAARGCYLAGYMSALQDVMALLDGGDFPRRSMPPSPSSPEASTGAETSFPSR